MLSTLLRRHMPDIFHWFLLKEIQVENQNKRAQMVIDERMKSEYQVPFYLQGIKNKVIAFAEGNGALLVFAFLGYLAIVKAFVLLAFFHWDRIIILHILFVLFLVLCLFSTWRLFRSETQFAAKKDLFEDRTTSLVGVIIEWMKNKQFDAIEDC